jgi:hypothetical protein
MLIIRDARARAIPMWNGGSSQAALAAVRDDVRDAVDDAVWPHTTQGRMTRRALVLFFGLPLPSMLLAGALDAGTGIFNLAVAIILGSVLTAILFWVPLARRPDAGSKYARQMMSLGHCPACAYALQGLDEEPDGCIICPECGGAWSRSAR